MGGHGWTGGGLAGSGTTLCSRCAAPAECGREAGLERRRAVHHCTDGKTEAPGRRGPQGLRNQRPARNWPSVPRPALLPSLWWPLHPLGSRITLSTVEALFMSLENRAALKGCGRPPSWVSLMAHMGKNPPAVPEAQETGLDPWSESCPGGGNGTRSRILAWETPWTEEPGRLPSTGPQRVGHD